MPRLVRELRWSPLNVPLMWTAAGHEASTLNGGFVEIQEAARLGGGIRCARRCGHCATRGFDHLVEEPRGFQVHKLAVTSQHEHRNIFCPKGVATTPEWGCWRLSTSRPCWNWGADWFQWGSPDKPERRHGSTTHTLHVGGHFG